MIGRCLCGGVRYQVRCRPDALYYCHCSQCRRSSGSSFATNIAVARDGLPQYPEDADVDRFP